MKTISIQYLAILLSGICLLSCSSPGASHSVIDQRVDSLLALMTIDEKIGQLYQVSGSGTEVEALIRQGKVGSVLNEVNSTVLNRLQKIAREESRLGIPILVGRDVIHGFKTIFPIPLGMAATWNPELIGQGAAVAADEAAAVGIHWTFAPMLDVSRDARWGRIAESFGEDPYLCSVFGAAMIRGFQGDKLDDKGSIASCAKHFAAYGAAEGGRDYNSVDVSMQTLYNVYLPPFKAAVDAGVATFMVSFNEINGIPSSGNEFLVKQLLKGEWGFKGLVVSDWASIEEMINHGFASDRKKAAELAFNAGIDMEMVTTNYNENLQSLIQEGKIDVKLLDDAVHRILRLKFQLGLFDDPYVEETANYDKLDSAHLALAKETAVQSIVLLKNERGILPLPKAIQRIAVIGPMADDGYEQLGTWIFDGEERHSITPLKAISEMLGADKVLYEKALRYSRDNDESDFNDALQKARQADAVIVIVGEESILSGEAHCRADLTLPGKQAEMVQLLKNAGKPVILIVMAGRPLVLGNVEPFCDAILYAWHPGTMAGPAITDILFGVYNPSGKLPVSFPVMSGQEPLYYAHKATGRPAIESLYTPIDSIPVRAFQTSLGNTSHYIDAGFKPAYCFGYGLSYTTYKYTNLSLTRNEINTNDTLKISIEVSNTGQVDGFETIQLYVKDKVGSITRPVKELKGFKRVFLSKGSTKLVEFSLTISDLAFYGKDMKLKAEPGDFIVYVGGNSEECLESAFRLVE
jgi:beta-glucosidase